MSSDTAAHARPSTLGRVRAAVSSFWVQLAGVVTASGGACVFVALADPTTPGGVSPPCVSKLCFGIVCPGCGSARMLYSLLHGRLGDALRYNALGVLAVPLVAWTLVAWIAWNVAGARIPRWEHRRWAPVAVGAAAVVWWIVRNLPFPPFTALHV